ncbi:MAG: hypothetical protein DRN29_02320 [Thermoplasmata archaeon]|nr:MAG: hypothetical protein DRN29_02320 [Thermoplasmata archaeon]
MKLKDMNEEELKLLIKESVREAAEDLIEDLIALSNKEFLKSIEEARSDYKQGKIKHFEELFDV